MGEEGTPKTEMINPALLDGVSANFIVKGPSGIEKAYPMRAITVTIGRSDQCDRATLTAFIAAARESQKSNPCAVAVDKLADVQRIQNNLGKPVCGKTAPKGEDARRVVGGYRDLARTYDRIVVSLSQFAAQFT